MGEFITRLDDNQLTTHDRLTVRSLLFAVRSAECIATREEHPIPAEWQQVVVLADVLESL